MDPTTDTANGSASTNNVKSRSEQMRAQIAAKIEKKDADKGMAAMETLLAERRQHEQAIQQIDLKIKAPRGYVPLEEGIRAKVAAICQRGRVEVGLTVSGDFSNQQDVKVNLPLATAYRRGLEQLETELALPSTPFAASLLASYPEVLSREQ